MSRLSCLLAFLCACSSPGRPAAVASPAPSPRDRGAPPAAEAVDPPQPTLRLPRNFTPTGYRARLAIDPAADRFTGAIEIDGDVAQRSKRFWLHGRGLTVSSAKLVRDGKPLRVEVATVGEDLLSIVPGEPIEPGRITLVFEYGAAFDTAEHVGAFKRIFDGNAYVVTQLESIYARRVFPCFDEPDNKVPWQLTLDVPSGLVAVANTPVASDNALAGGARRIAFAPTHPLPSYLVAFAVGPYEIVDAGKTRNGTPLRILALKGRAREAQWAAETTPRIVQLLEDYFGIPYPYEKLDQLAQPVLLGGAMENAGLITYAKGLLLNDPAQITPSDRAWWVSVAAHEIAHHWFGDLVTTAWWDDIWLNEGFASWLSAKIVEQFEPAWRGELLDTSARDTALYEDSRVTARRVRQPIAVVGDIFQAFDSITYEKGHSVLAMFEHAIGPERFRDGVRAYIAGHRDGSATSTDFLAAISAVAGHDVAPAFRTFLDQAGAPRVQGELRCEAGRSPTVRLTQQRHVLPGGPPAPPGVPWHIPVCIAYDRGGARGETCAELSAPSADVTLDARTCPTWMFPNAGGRGYYRTLLPEAGIAALRDRGWAQLTPVERMVAFHDLAALDRGGAVPIALEMSLVPKLVAERHHIAIEAAEYAVFRTRRSLSPANRPALDAWVQRTFGPTARALSWRQRAHDDLDASRSRQVLVPLVAWSGDVVLRKAAVELARSWRTLGTAYRQQILAIAADADRATFERLLAAAPVERDAELRQDMLVALGDVSDPARLRTALALVWDSRLSSDEARRLVFSGRAIEQFAIVAAYFREHMQQLLARFPENGREDNDRFAFVFTRVCDPDTRDDTAAFVQRTFSGMIGGERLVAQSLEGLDQCVASRRLLGPQLDAWIAKQ